MMTTQIHSNTNIQNYIQSVSSKLFLILCAILSLSLIFLFNDSCQLDGSLHYLFAKWAVKNHELYIGVWARPFYTLIYSLPTQFGYTASRVFTVFVCLIIAWQTYKLSCDLKIDRSPPVILLLFLQPSFFLFSADNMTEPVFALIFITALRLHFNGYVNSGMFAASFLVTARPEGFFLIPLWWLFNIKSNDRIEVKNLVKNLLLLSGGFFIWWVSAYFLTNDPLFILHNWPSNWTFDSSIYGKAGLLAYPLRLPEIIGPLLLIPFLFGLYTLVKKAELIEITSPFLMLFIVHTILRAFGMFGSAGYPRYMICVSPAIAIITLVGWNKLSLNIKSGRTVISILVITLSVCVNFLYADGAEWSRDSIAINQIHSQFGNIPVNRLISSNPYTFIAFKRDPWENPQFTRDHKRNLEILKNSPPNTVVVWDDKVGPKEYGLTVSDFQSAGYTIIHSESFVLKGHFLPRSFFGYGGPRKLTIYLLDNNLTQRREDAKRGYLELNANQGYVRSTAFRRKEKI